MTSNPQYIFDIIQDHFLEFFDVLVKIVDCGWWSTMNVIIGPPDDAVLMNAVAGGKLVKLGQNKIERQKTFCKILFQFYHCWYPLNTESDIYLLAFRGLYENMVSLLFHEKMFTHPCG